MTTDYEKSTNYHAGTTGLGSEKDSQTNKFRQEGSAAADQAKQSSKEALNKVNEQVRSSVDQVKQQGEAHFEKGKEVTADELGGVAKALHSTADELDSQNHGQIADYVDLAAQRLDHVSNAIRSQDLNGVIAQVENFARQQPAVFLGAAVAAGIFAGRFLKSSEERHTYSYDDEYTYDDGYGSDYADDESYADDYAYAPDNDDDDRLNHSSKYGYPLAPNEVVTDEKPYDPITDKPSNPVVTPAEPKQVSGIGSESAAKPTILPENAPPRTPVDFPPSEDPLSSDSLKK